MPHSSGGGSHRSGSHHSHSSHSSHRGGSSTPSRRVRRNNFAGSTRYVYYEKNKPVFVYANYDITQKRSSFRYLILLFYIPFILALIPMFKSAVHHPVKLKPDYDTEIIIDDKIGAIDNISSLEKSLNDFYDETGITPAVMTVYNEEWQNNYDNLENYAYDLYVNAFSDEKHWLIVYSESYQSSDSFVDWYFEGMQGDDTDNIITENVAERFTDNLNKSLTARSRYTVSEAIGNTLENIIPYAMSTTINGGVIITSIVILLFIFLHAFLMVGFNFKEKKYSTAKKCPNDLQEEICEYCNGVYVVGTCTSCPHCGAPVKIHDYSTESNTI